MDYILFPLVAAGLAAMFLMAFAIIAVLVLLDAERRERRHASVMKQRCTVYAARAAMDEASREFEEKVAQCLRR